MKQIVYAALLGYTAAQTIYVPVEEDPRFHNSPLSAEVIAEMNAVRVVREKTQTHRTRKPVEAPPAELDVDGNPLPVEREVLSDHYVDWDKDEYYYYYSINDAIFHRCDTDSDSELSEDELIDCLMENYIDDEEHRSAMRFDIMEEFHRIEYPNRWDWLDIYDFRDFNPRWFKILIDPQFSEAVRNTDISEPHPGVKTPNYYGGNYSRWDRHLQANSYFGTSEFGKFKEMKEAAKLAKEAAKEALPHFDKVAYEASKAAMDLKKDEVLARHNPPPN